MLTVPDYYKSNNKEYGYLAMPRFIILQCKKKKKEKENMFSMHQVSIHPQQGILILCVHLALELVLCL